MASRRGDDRKRVHVVEDIRVADALEGVPDPMQAYQRLVASSGAVDELVEKQSNARRKLFKGLPVRTTWLHTQTFDGGWSASRTLTIDLLDLKRADLDPEAFRVPDGYGRIDLAARMKAVFDRMLTTGKEARKESATGRKTP